MSLSIEEEAGMNWMAGCMLIILSIVYSALSFAGLKWVLLIAICGVIVGFFSIFKAIKQIKLFAKRDK